MFVTGDQRRGQRACGRGCSEGDETPPTPHSHREPGTPRAGSCGRRPRWQRVAARRKARPHARTLVSSLHSSPRFTRPRTRVLFSHSSLRALGSPCAVRGTRCVMGRRVRDPLPAARVRTRKPVPSVCRVPGTGAGTKFHKAKSPSLRSSRASQGDSKPPTNTHTHGRHLPTEMHPWETGREHRRPSPVLRSRTREATVWAPEVSCRWWHLCWPNSHPIGDLPLSPPFLMSPPTPKCPQAGEGRLRVGSGAARGSSGSCLSSNPEMAVVRGDRGGDRGSPVGLRPPHPSPPKKAQVALLPWLCPPPPTPTRFGAKALGPPPVRQMCTQLDGRLRPQLPHTPPEAVFSAAQTSRERICSEVQVVIKTQAVSSRGPQRPPCPQPRPPLNANETPLRLGSRACRLCPGKPGEASRNVQPPRLT